MTLSAKSTRITQHIRASRAMVYRALLDGNRIAEWKVPAGMTAKVHELGARAGGRIRVSLTYEAPGHAGKSTSNTDTYHGRFEKLVPDEEIVEIDEFETANPAMMGEMSITITLRDAGGGTELTAVHENLPRGVAPADNETGWRMALAKLAVMVEAEAHQ